MLYMNIRDLKVNDIVPLPPKPKPETEIMATWKGDVSKPLVSILCPTYNHVNYISDTLNGFLIQETDFPFEIIINDDASTDGTTEIVKKYAEVYPNIIIPIIQDENQWSKGVRPRTVLHPKARGKYIAICEGDDYWLDKHKIAKQLSVLESDENTVMAYHHAICIDENGLVVGSHKASENGYLRKELKKSPIIPTLTRLYRNKDYPWLKEASLPIAGDIVQTTYLSRFGGARFVDEIIPSVYRQHEGGVWSQQSNINKTRTSIDALLFIAERYESESDTEGKLYFLNRAITYALELTSTKELLLIAINVLRFTFKKIMKNVRWKIKKLLKLS